MHHRDSQLLERLSSVHIPRVHVPTVHMPTVHIPRVPRPGRKSGPDNAADEHAAEGDKDASGLHDGGLSQDIETVVTQVDGVS